MTKWESTSDVGVHLAKCGISKGSKEKYFLDCTGFMGWAH